MRILFAVIIMLLTFTLAEAEMYQWIAEDGSVTFKDTPPLASKKRKKVKVYNDSEFAPAPTQQSIDEAEAKAKAEAEARTKARAKEEAEARAKADAKAEAESRAKANAKAEAELRARLKENRDKPDPEQRARDREYNNTQRMLNYERHRPWNDRTGGLN